jgi:putative acetyltransferase
MVSIVRTDSENQDFIELVKYLDDYLAELDGEEHAFYNQLNKIDKIKHAVVAYENDRAMGCGAMRALDPYVMEIKRMYTVPEGRGKGVATRILNELEKWASELNYQKCILETGIRQPEAIALYRKRGFQVIANYGKYKNIENSVCFEKQIQSAKKS